MPELKDLCVDWISLVKRPANGKPLTLKSGARARAVRLAKVDDEAMRAYGIVYSPDEVDAQGDWASADTIRRAADQFMREGRTVQVDREHDFRPSGHFVAESWIVRAGDPLFLSEKAGAWAVGIQVTDPIEWRALKNGDREGLSLAGSATVQEVQSDGVWVGKDRGDAPGWFTRFLKSFQLAASPEGGEEMTDDQVKKIASAAAIEAVTLALKKYDTDPKGPDAGQIADAVAKALVPELAKLSEASDKTAADLATLKGEVETLKADLAKSLGKGQAEGGGSGTGEFGPESPEGWL